jgi:phosphate transport system substrate-binding protein
MTKRAAAALLLSVPLVVGAACQNGAAAAVTRESAPDLAGNRSAFSAQAITLNGAGANSIDPFYSKVFYDYHKAHRNVTVNYSPAGSSVGVSDIQQGTVDFGDSEIPMAAKDLAKAKGPVLQVPVDLGGVAISYNLPGAPKDLRLDGPTLAGIFDGTITNWDSAAIAKVSGLNNLPNLAITPVHRADSSGPGWDLDDYLIKTSTDWVAKTGTDKASKSWPLADVGVGEQLNSGVATYISQTSGAIGYVEYGYALQAGFSNAAVQNAGGAFVAPSESTIAQAGTYAVKLSAKNFSIIDNSGPSTYPLANFSWALLYRKQANAATGAALAALLSYVITTGQSQAAALGYAPLPANVVALAKTTLSELETSAGKPIPA